MLIVKLNDVPDVLFFTLLDGPTPLNPTTPIFKMGLLVQPVYLAQKIEMNDTRRDI